MDRYSLPIRTSPSANLASARAKRYKLTGPGYSYLNVEVKVFCDANYFVPDCSTYCVPRDCGSTGHYICDYTKGRRVCLSGWFGSDCLTYCVARNDTLGHYNCDENGQKQCFSNWYGKDCLVYCKPRNDTQGHYKCDSAVNNDCLPRWRGKNCTEGEILNGLGRVSSLNFLTTTGHSPAQNALSTMAMLLVNHELVSQLSFLKETLGATFRGLKYNWI